MATVGRLLRGTGFGWFGVVVVQGAAFAQSPVDGTYLGLSFTGDGQTPSALELFDAQRRAAMPARYGVESSPSGDAGYRMAFDLPPSLLQPSLGLSYSSASGAHSTVGRGWTVDGGMTIRAPSPHEATHAYADSPGLLIVEGGGVRGQLLQRQDGLGWNFHSAEPGAVVVVEAFPAGGCRGSEAVSLCFEVTSGGRTTTLEASNDAENPTAWRTVHVEDEGGNAIVYDWNGITLHAVRYGQRTGMQDYTTEVGFVYDFERGHATTDWSRGQFESIDELLTEVVVRSAKFGQKPSDRYGWRLAYEEVDGEWMLSEVVRVGGPPGDASAPSVRVASFGYTHFEDHAEDSVFSSEDVASLGESTSDARGVLAHSVTWTRMADVTGDGLPDALALVGDVGVMAQYLDFATWPPESHWQEVADGASVWDAYLPGGASSGLLDAQVNVQDGLDDAVTVPCDDGQSVTYTTRKVVDVDGDGLLDLVEAQDPTPVPWVDPNHPGGFGYDGPSTADPWCDEVVTIAAPFPGATWKVYWGSRGGDFSSVSLVEGVPRGWPSIAQRAQLREVHPCCDNQDPADCAPLPQDPIIECPYTVPTEETHPNPNDPAWHQREGVDGPIVDLMDVNGDGWADLVEAADGTGVLDAGFWVNLAIPARGAGWEPEAIPWLLTDPGEVRGLSHSLGEIDWVAFNLDVFNQGYSGIRTVGARSPVIGQTWQLAGFVDLNADGLVDYVDADPGADEDWEPDAYGPVWWTVWLGTAQGLADPVNWRVPAGQRFLGWSSEGKASVKSMSPPPPGTNVSVIEADRGNHTVTCESTSVDETQFCGVPDEDGTIVFVQCGGWTTREECGTADSGAIPASATGDAQSVASAIRDQLQARTPMAAYSEGCRQRELSRLLDVDADGRQDLVVFAANGEIGASCEDFGDEPDGTWYRNLGDRFDAGRATPSWWGGDLGATYGRQDVLISPYVNDVLPDQRDWLQDFTIPSLSHTTVVASVQDVNADGVLDIVDRGVRFEPDELGDEAPVLDPWHVWLGVGTRSGLLSLVETRYGATTTLGYTSSSFAWPSGELGVDHRMAQRKDLLTETYVEDPVTGHAALRDVSFADGVCEGGVCQGFGEVSVEERLHDPEIHTTPVIGWDGRPELQLVSRTTTEYLLDRDFAVPVLETIEVSSAHPVPETGLGTSVVLDLPRERTAWEYVIDDTADDPARSDLGTFRTAWSRGLVRTETAASGAVWTTRSVAIEVVREAGTGLVTDVIHYAEEDELPPPDVLTPHVNDHQDNVAVHVDYAWNDDHTLRLPTQRRTTAWDHAALDRRVVERGRLFYDGSTDLGQGITSGRLTRQEVDAGEPHLSLGAEELVWEFTYTDRGALTMTVDPRGAVTIRDAFTFGGALPGFASTWVNVGQPDLVDATGALLQRGEHELYTFTSYDDLGRPFLQEDSNGVMNWTAYDGFGRVVGTSVIPVGGGELALTETAYHDDDATFPRYVSQTTFEDAVGTASTTYEVLDGFGDATQTWRPSATGSYLVQESVRDIAGSVVRTTHPATHGLSGGGPDYWGTRSEEWLSWTELDAFGLPRRTFEDRASGDLGEVVTSYPSPGVVVTEDASGYTHETRSDTHGRVRTVVEGQWGEASPPGDACEPERAAGHLKHTTGTYAYDGRGRLAKFTDANGDLHQYTFDGAGRLRQVWRKAATALTPGGAAPLGLTQCLTHTKGTLKGPAVARACGQGSPNGLAGLTPWYAYTWDGHLPYETYEGSVATGTKVAESHQDELGRPTSKRVWNRDEGLAGEGAWDDYRWAWDLAWDGSLGRATDPAGAVAYEYEPAAWGGLGQVSAETRTWDQVGHVSRFDHERDLLGRAVRTTWPDGTEVSTSFSPGGWLVGHQVDTSSGLTAVASYGYDGKGLLAGMTAGETTPGATPFDVTYERTPTRLRSVAWERDGTLLRSVGFEHDNAGRLTFKDIVPEPVVESTLEYRYDELQRVVCMKETGPNDVLEWYRYDRAGNPTAVSRPGVSRNDGWTYGTGAFGKLGSRTDLGNTTLERYEYDTQGRMSRWDTFLGNLNPGNGQNGDVTRAFTYDGLGRLVRQVQESGGSLEYDTKLVYDAGNEAVYEERSGQRSEVVTRFRGERVDHVPGGETVLQVLPYLRVADGELRWTLADQDGHALAVWDSTGSELQFEVGGVYGDRFDRGSPYFQADLGTLGSPWDVDGLHGAEPDRELGLAHRGARHAALNDGRWLQPEPLLAVGRMSVFPRDASPVYAGGNPVMFGDNSGRSRFLFQPGMDSGGGGGGGAVGGGAGPMPVQVDTAQLAAAAKVVAGAAAAYVLSVVLPDEPVSMGAPPLVQPTLPSGPMAGTQPDPVGAGPQVNVPVPSVGGEVEGYSADQIQAPTFMTSEASKVVPTRSLSRTHAIEGNASSRQVREMAADMAENGFDAAHPIDVVESGSEMFIVDGHHRFAAAKRAGIQEVPVNVVDDIAAHPSSFQSVEEVVQDAATVGPDRLRR